MTLHYNLKYCFNKYANDIDVTLLDVFPCAVHNLPNHMQWLYMVAISDSVEVMQTNWTTQQY